ncbi:MAG: LIC_13387 family protein [Solirubrobacteraceae bacterium]
MSVAEGFFIAGTIPFAVLGSAHIGLTLRDLRHPTYFKPTDDTLILALKGTGVAVMAPVPRAHTMWRAWLGANLTHGLGLLAFALLLLAIALHDYALVSNIAGIRPLSITVALSYVLIAVRTWFLPAAATTSVGLTCFVIAAIA